MSKTINVTTNGELNNSRIIGKYLILYARIIHKSPQWLPLLSILRGGSVIVDSLFIVAPIVCGGFVFDNVHRDICLFKDQEWFTRLILAFALLFFKHACPAI